MNTVQLSDNDIINMPANVYDSNNQIKLFKFHS